MKHMTYYRQRDRGRQVFLYHNYFFSLFSLHVYAFWHLLFYAHILIIHSKSFWLIFEASFLLVAMTKDWRGEIKDPHGRALTKISFKLFFLFLFFFFLFSFWQLLKDPRGRPYYGFFQTCESDKRGNKKKN